MAEAAARGGPLPGSHAEKFSFVIQGHVCCTEGELDAIDRKTNKRNLSVARAKFVYDFLLKRGIKKSRMSYEGMAHKFPFGGSEDKDRRVAHLLASQMRRHPLVPAQPDDEATKPL